MARGRKQRRPDPMNRKLDDMFAQQTERQRAKQRQQEPSSDGFEILDGPPPPPPPTTRLPIASSSENARKRQSSLSSPTSLHSRANSPSLLGARSPSPIFRPTAHKGKGKDVLPASPSPPPLRQARWEAVGSDVEAEESGEEGEQMEALADIEADDEADEGPARITVAEQRRLLQLDLPGVHASIKDLHGEPTLRLIFEGLKEVRRGFTQAAWRRHNQAVRRRTVQDADVQDEAALARRRLRQVASLAEAAGLTYRGFAAPTSSSKAALHGRLCWPPSKEGLEDCIFCDLFTPKTLALKGFGNDIVDVHIRDVQEFRVAKYNKKSLPRCSEDVWTTAKSYFAGSTEPSEQHLQGFADIIENGYARDREITTRAAKRPTLSVTWGTYAQAARNQHLKVRVAPRNLVKFSYDVPVPAIPSLGTEADTFVAKARAVFTDEDQLLLLDLNAAHPSMSMFNRVRATRFYQLGVVCDVVTNLLAFLADIDIPDHSMDLFARHNLPTPRSAESLTGSWGMCVLRMLQVEGGDIDDVTYDTLPDQLKHWLDATGVPPDAQSSSRRARTSPTWLSRWLGAYQCHLKAKVSPAAQMRATVRWLRTCLISVDREDIDLARQSLESGYAGRASPVATSTSTAAPFKNNRTVYDDRQIVFFDIWSDDQVTVTVREVVEPTAKCGPAVNGQIMSREQLNSLLAPLYIEDKARLPHLHHRKTLWFYCKTHGLFFPRHARPMGQTIYFAYPRTKKDGATCCPLCGNDLSHRAQTTFSPDCRHTKGFDIIVFTSSSKPNVTVPACGTIPVPAHFGTVHTIPRPDIPHIIREMKKDRGSKTGKRRSIVPDVRDYLDADVNWRERARTWATHILKHGAEALGVSAFFPAKFQLPV